MSKKVNNGKYTKQQLYERILEKRKVTKKKDMTRKR